MGIYLNHGNEKFQRALDSEIYIDKTELLTFTNSKLFTKQQFICVSRPRRFGKSMAADMLAAYYSKGCDSRGLFSKLKIANDKGFEKYLNKYNVIQINMLNFFSKTKTVNEAINYLERRLLHEIKKEYGDIDCFDWSDLSSVCEDVYAETKIPFVFIIDEWDCVFRFNQTAKGKQEEYLEFLRNLLKDRVYIALAYMTGILPIKKYGEHSALNMFDEYSMTNQGSLAEFTGFTEDEVKSLCSQYNMPFETTKEWYDGYDLGGMSIYNPRSVVTAMLERTYDDYWTKTESYEAVKTYIQMNYDGLRDSVVQLIAGERIVIDTTTFVNDMVTFEIKDDVLTLLIHLGYLGFDFKTKEVFIPNYEIRQQFISTVRVLGWNDVIKSIEISN